MNGYPDWIPASEPPKSSGSYQVTIRDMTDGHCFVRNADYVASPICASGAAWSVHPQNAVLAWMPLPPAYEPPKFGWHPAIEPPSRDGTYLVKYFCSEHDGTLFATDVFSSKCGWGLSYRVRFWSHIEPTTDAR